MQRRTAAATRCFASGRRIRRGRVCAGPIVVAIIGIIASIAIPGLLRARMAGNEASAIGSLRSLHSGQHAFWASCGGGSYAPSLQNLGLSGYIANDLSRPAPVVKSGYRISMGSAQVVPGTSCNGGAINSSYQATADPVTPGQTGQRYFGTNATGAIYQSTATLTGVMPESNAPPPPAFPLQQ